MKDGFIKISAVTPEVIVADPAANAEKTAKAAEDAAAEGAAGAESASPPKGRGSIQNSSPSTHAARFIRG